jgi:hypothetical protein
MSGMVGAAPILSPTRTSSSLALTLPLTLTLNLTLTLTLTLPLPPAPFPLPPLQALPGLPRPKPLLALVTTAC